MKILRFLILGLLAMTAIVCRAQITDPGWFRVQKPASPAQPRSSFSSATGSGPRTNYPAVQVSRNSPVAEVVTPQIQALADGLQDDPMRIFNYVHDHIKFVLYFGSKKGAELTLLEKSGNDFDQWPCWSLCCARRVTPMFRHVGYQFGWQEIPYDDPYGTTMICITGGN